MAVHIDGQYKYINTYKTLPWSGTFGQSGTSGDHLLQPSIPPTPHNGSQHVMNYGGTLCWVVSQFHRPGIFGKTSYYTTTPAYFTNIPLFRLSFPEHFFHFKATQWRNLLPSFMTDCLNKPFHQYVDALGQYCSSLYKFC